MSQERPVGNSSEGISDVLWTSALAGVGSVLIEMLLVVSFYLFEPAVKSFVDLHITYFLVSVPFVFVAGFGFALQSTLEFQFWRGKWK